MPALSGRRQSKNAVPAAIRGGMYWLFYLSIYLTLFISIYLTVFYLSISLSYSLLCITPYTITQLHDTGLYKTFFYNVITYWYDNTPYRYYTIIRLGRPRLNKHTHSSKSKKWAFNTNKILHIINNGYGRYESISFKTKLHLPLSEFQHFYRNVNFLVRTHTLFGQLWEKRDSI